MAELTETFDPANLRKHLRPMKGGSEYMDVKWRLVWLREQHPNATIDTVELSHIPEKSATFKAFVSVPGGGSASGHGSETASDFRDYYEKAETKALGRALAALGFGTQFLPDDNEALADAPVTHPQPRSATEPPRPDVGSSETINRDTGEIMRLRQPATEKQVKFLHAIAKDRGLSHDDLHTQAMQTYGVGVGELDRAQVSAFIDVLNPKDGQAGPAPTPIRQSPPAEEPDETSYTEFWRWARLQGVDRPKFEELTQQFVEGKTAQQLRSSLETALASMPKAGTAGNDRFTS